MKTEYTLPHYTLEESIFNIRYFRLYDVDFLQKNGWTICKQWSPDQMPHYAASDLGLYSLPITRLGVSSLQWVYHHKNIKYFTCKMNKKKKSHSVKEISYMHKILWQSPRKATKYLFFLQDTTALYNTIAGIQIKYKHVVAMQKIYRKYRNMTMNGHFSI